METAQPSWFRWRSHHALESSVWTEYKLAKGIMWQRQKNGFIPIRPWMISAIKAEEPTTDSSSEYRFNQADQKN